MWHGPVTSCAWFNNYDSSKPTRANTSSSSILPVASVHMGKNVYTEKYTEMPEKRSGSRRERQYPNSSTRPYQSRNPYPTSLPKTTSPGRYQRQGSGSSPQNGSATVADLENGGMLNPYSRGPARGAPR